MSALIPSPRDADIPEVTGDLAAAELESARLAELAAYGIMDAPPDPAFDAITEAASLVAGTPVATIGLIDQDRQHYLSEQGVGVRDIPRTEAFCDVVVRDRAPLLVSDLTQDDRFADNPNVTDRGARFYAGFPLTTASGMVLGAMCVIDVSTRSLTPDQVTVLSTLADQAMAQIELRRQTAAAYEARDAAQERNDLLAAVVNSIDVGILVCDAEGVMIVDNEVYRADTGVRTDELAPLTLAERIARVRLRHPDGSPMRPEERPMYRALHEGHVEGVEVLIQRDGQERMSRVHGDLLRRPDGSVLGAMIAAVDITGDWEREQELATRVRHVERLAEASRAILTSRDPGQVACEAVLELSGAQQVSLAVPDGAGNLVFPATTGPALSELVIPLTVDSRAGQAFWEHKLLRVDLDAEASFGEAFDRITDVHGRPRGGLYVPLLHEDDCLGVLLLTTADPIDRLSPQVVELIDILAGELSTSLERDRLRRELASQASTDPLTGLANRREWDRRLAERLALGAVPQCLAVLDLDLFKAFNDSLGHQAGDRLLTAVSAAWRGAIRGADVLARLGGEEFGLLLAGCALEDAVSVLDNLRRLVPDGQTVSIGVAQLRPGEGPTSWYARADQALYRAKTTGRNRVCVDDGPYPDRRRFPAPVFSAKADAPDA